jgi:hypothetical protein
VRAAIVAGIAWSAVHAYTGAIFVAVSVFATLVGQPLITGDRRASVRAALAVAGVVALLQVPYAIHQLNQGFGNSALGAVWDSMARVVSGRDSLRLEQSAAGYVAAVQFIQVAPRSVPFAGWGLLACGAILAIRYRRDPVVLAMTLLPQAMAVVVFALFLAELDHYYYFSLMPAAVLTCVLAVAAPPSHRIGRTVNIALFLGALALVPGRVQLASTLHKMPEYGVLVDASRKIRNRNQPMRAIRTDFGLPPSANPEFVYSVLGGVIDRSSPWIATIGADGRVTYQQLQER